MESSCQEETHLLRKGCRKNSKGMTMKCAWRADAKCRTNPGAKNYKRAAFLAGLMMKDGSLQDRQ
jgi:hypothetical protein